MIKIFVFSSFLILTGVYAQNSINPGHEFDLIIFTQSWPATVCIDWKNNNPTHTCTMPKKDNIWTIHGIWPTKLGTIGPSFCNRTWLFDPEQIRPIEDDLTSMWTNIFGGTVEYRLWAHEWSKHGTCAAALEQFNSEFKYFSTGLAWLKKYSMPKILESANILPSNTKGYLLDDIRDAVINKLDIHPAIECKKENDQSYLSEIRICFTKQLQLVNCDGIKGEGTSLSNCDPSKEIIYPHYSNSEYLYVQLYKLASWLQWFTL